MDELEILHRVLPLLPQNHDTVVGPGDDCAIIKIGNEFQLLAVDQVVSGVHYVPGKTPAGVVAAKLLKRNLSDIAAMGGKPHCALLTLAGNIDNDQWYLDFFAGLAATAEQYEVAVSGGDLASLPPGCPPDCMVATLTITGKVAPEQICLRRNATVGDKIFVTGQFGDSFKSQHHLNFTPRLKEAGFLAGRFTRSMIDVSDGLLLDLGRIAAASKVGMELHCEDIPRRPGASIEQALGDGEDYELIMAVPEDAAENLQRQWPFSTLLTEVGTVVEEHPGLVFDRKGVNLSTTHKSGFKHLSIK